jgi:hypothetical protein
MTHSAATFTPIGGEWRELEWRLQRGPNIENPNRCKKIYVFRLSSHHHPLPPGTEWFSAMISVSPATLPVACAPCL